MMAQNDMAFRQTRNPLEQPVCTTSQKLQSRDFQAEENKAMNRATPKAIQDLRSRSPHSRRIGKPFAENVYRNFRAICRFEIVARNVEPDIFEIGLCKKSVSKSPNALPLCPFSFEPHFSPLPYPIEIEARQPPLIGIRNTGVDHALQRFEHC